MLIDTAESTADSVKDSVSRKRRDLGDKIESNVESAKAKAHGNSELFLLYIIIYSNL